MVVKLAWIDHAAGGSLVRLRHWALPLLDGVKSQGREAKVEVEEGPSVHYRFVGRVMRSRGLEEWGLNIAMKRGEWGLRPLPCG